MGWELVAHERILKRRGGKKVCLVTQKRQFRHKLEKGKSVIWGQIKGPPELLKIFLLQPKPCTKPQMMKRRYRKRLLLKQTQEKESAAIISTVPSRPHFPTDLTKAVLIIDTSHEIPYLPAQTDVWLVSREDLEKDDHLDLKRLVCRGRGKPCSLQLCEAAQQTWSKDPSHSETHVPPISVGCDYWYVHVFRVEYQACMTRLPELPSLDQGLAGVFAIPPLQGEDSADESDEMMKS
jgi:hypothetical protein